MCQSQRVVPSPRSVLPTSLPLETSTSRLGIVTLKSIDSTSSRHWSLLGHQMLAPGPSQDVQIQGQPAGSCRNDMPPNRPVELGFPE